MGRRGTGRGGMAGLRVGTVADEGQRFLDDTLNTMNAERDHIKGLLLGALVFMGFPLSQAVPAHVKEAFKTDLRATCGDTMTMVTTMHSTIIEVMTAVSLGVKQKTLVVSCMFELLMEEPDLRLPPRPTIAQLMTNPQAKQVWLKACYFRIREFMGVKGEVDVIMFEPEAVVP